MSALRSGAEGKLRCRTDSTLRSVLPVYDTTPLAPGIYTLQLRAHGVENYHPPTRLRARLHHLDGVGLASVPSVPSAQETARQQLYLGRSDASPADEEAAWGALARGDAAALRDALANLWERGDRRRLRWLLRSSGSDVVVPLASVAGTGFPALFEEAWDAKSTGGFVDPSLHDELLRPSLAMLPASDPAGARLRLERAEVRLQRGDRAGARTLAESVLAEASDVAPKIDAWLLLARLAESEAEAHEAEEQAIALDPTGRTQERVRRERASTGGP